MAKLHHSAIAQETELRQAAVIQRMMGDLERTVQILSIHISTEEERVRVLIDLCQRTRSGQER